MLCAACGQDEDGGADVVPDAGQIQDTGNGEPDVSQDEDAAAQDDAGDLVEMPMDAEETPDAGVEDVPSPEDAVDANPDPEPDVNDDASPMVDADEPDMGADAQDPPDDVLAPIPQDWPQSRGWDWVRSNETFVSAMATRMGAPPQAAVDRYYDDFGATAAHLWAAGVPTASAGWYGARPTRWLAWFNSDGTSAETNTFMGGPVQDGRLGYQIGDEPRNRAEFEETLASFNTVRAADPEALLVFNYTYIADEIDAFLRESCSNGNVDVFSYDRYTYSNAHYETIGLFRDAAIACGIPYWRYMGAIPTNRQLSPSGMRWDAMLGIVYGYTGHTWFVYNISIWEPENIPSIFFTTPDDWASPTTTWFDVAAQLNQELVVYGQAQRRLRSKTVSYFTPVPIPLVHPPEGISQWTSGTGQDPYLRAISPVSGAPVQDAALGHYEDPYGDTYVVIQNPNRVDGSFPNDSDATATFRLELDFGGAPPNVRSDRVIQLGADGVLRALPVQNGSLNLTIEAGDVIFFKYDTGRPFAGYEETPLP